MAEMKYGHREGPGKGKEMPVAASQYFHRRGGHFVVANAAGHMLVASTVNSASPLVGWAEVPKDASLKSSWKSSSTAGADSVFVITGLENIFEMPVDKSVASANATLVGKGCGITDANATYTMIQRAAYYATAASCNLVVHDYDKDNQTVRVSIKPDKYMVA